MSITIITERHNPTTKKEFLHSLIHGHHIIDQRLSFKEKTLQVILKMNKCLFGDEVEAGATNTNTQVEIASPSIMRIHKKNQENTTTPDQVAWNEKRLLKQIRHLVIVTTQDLEEPTNLLTSLTNHPSHKL
jgi:hypothetical protein